MEGFNVPKKVRYIIYCAIVCVLLVALLWTGAQLRDNGKRAVTDQERVRKLETTNSELERLEVERLAIIGELESTVRDLNAERDRRAKAIDGIESSTGSIERIIETVKKRGPLFDR
jgi:hypothetical protein